MDAEVPITIIGPGAVGVVLGVTAAAAGYAPHFIGRAGPVAVESTVTTASGTLNLKRAAPSSSTLAQSALVLVAVRAPDVAAALAWMPRLPIKASVLVLSNGAVDALMTESAESWPGRLLRRGLVTLGIAQVAASAWTVRSTQGSVVFGPWPHPKGTPTNAEALLIHRIPHLFQWDESAVHAVRRKWVFNTVINTLCAAMGLDHNGALLQHEGQVKEAFEEALALAHTRWGGLPWDAPTLWRDLISLIQNTAVNENSMVRDVRMGRQTEAPWLSGIAEDPARYPLLVKLTATITKRAPTARS